MEVESLAKHVGMPEKKVETSAMQVELAVTLAAMKDGPTPSPQRPQESHLAAEKKWLDQAAEFEDLKKRPREAAALHWPQGLGMVPVVADEAPVHGPHLRQLQLSRSSCCA